MVANLFPYPEYRESIVPWLDRVPEHWQTRQLRTLASEPIRNGVGESAQPFRPDWPRYIRITDIAGPRALRTNTRASLPLETAAGARVKEGDLLLAAVGATYGKSYLHRDVGTPACFAGYLVRLSPNAEVSPEFLSYWTESAAYWDQLNSQVIQSTIQNFSAGRYKGLRVPLPPLEEQAAIVRFLEYADRRIRRFIAAKKELIALLNEQKRAIIHRAVTRGLDPSVRLKPSGVEWLGDIPAHWEVVRAKRLFSPRRDLALPGDVQLSATQAYGVIPQAEFEAKVGRRVVKISMHLEQRRHVEKGDFVISMRSFQGGLERAWASGAIRSSYVVLKRAPLVDVGFFSYLFKSRGYIRALQATADFIRDGQDLNFGNFCDVGLPLGPLDEQKAIAASISGLTADIDVALAHTEREIALVREYRARLISDVVTGRLDVREAAERLPDEPEQPEPNDRPDAMTDTDDEIADDTNAVGEQVEV
jgi:type I restriction enzyme, S subunit